MKAVLTKWTLGSPQTTLLRTADLEQCFSYYKRNSICIVEKLNIQKTGQKKMKTAHDVTIQCICILVRKCSR